MSEAEACMQRESFSIVGEAWTSYRKFLLCISWDRRVCGSDLKTWEELCEQGPGKFTELPGKGNHVIWLEPSRLAGKWWVGS